MDLDTPILLPLALPPPVILASLARDTQTHLFPAPKIVYLPPCPPAPVSKRVRTTGGLGDSQYSGGRGVCCGTGKNNAELGHSDYTNQLKEYSWFTEEQRQMLFGYIFAPMSQGQVAPVVPEQPTPRQVTSRVRNAPRYDSHPRPVVQGDAAEE